MTLLVHRDMTLLVRRDMTLHRICRSQPCASLAGDILGEGDTDQSEYCPQGGSGTEWDVEERMGWDPADALDSARIMIESMSGTSNTLLVLHDMAL